ncbi:Transposase, MuDR, plant [Corchorus olitorius]|uniref:Transposase, MuDR, plant n=1 Tax=Corchorus olitorius TaxID=93759 RepID=A0A1R3I3F5_9ROSI|nr:Transposase, MuDR, plant [Corchorus olitorius]
MVFAIYIGLFIEWFPEIDTRSSPVNWTIYEIAVHHGGVLVDNPSIEYVNGKTQVFDWYDPEKLCLWSVVSLAASCGYNVNSIKKLRFCRAGVSLDEGLKLLFDDDSVSSLCKHLEEDKLVNFYVEHGGIGEPGITGGEVPLPVGYSEPAGDHVDLVSSGDENGDHSSSKEEEARVLEENEEERENIVDVNVDFDSDGGGIGADPELVNSRMIVHRRLEHKERLRKEMEELVVEELVSIPVEQRQKKKQKKKKHDGGSSGASTAGPSGGGHNAAGPNQNVQADIDRAESPYFDSDQPNSFIKTDSEDSEADDAQRCISRGLNFRPDGSVPEFFKEQFFTGPAQFKATLKEYSLGKQKAFYYKKNDKQRVRAHCSTNACDWEIMASYHCGDGSFRVKTYNDNHTCNEAKRNKRLTAKVMAEKLGDVISEMPTIRAK